MSSIYKPIPDIGTGRWSFQLGMRNKLYTAPDHLLVVQSSGYTEEYRRVFFRDIRSIDIRPSQAQMGNAIVSGLFLLFFGLMAWVFHPTAFLILASPFVLWFIINLALGPSVYCYVTTSVQALKLPAPRRRGKVARFVTFVREQAALSQAAAPANA